MTELFSDYEAQIAAHQKKIEELKQQQSELDRKRKGIEEFNAAVEKICKTYDMEEYELVLSRGDQLAKWMKKFVKVDQPPKFFDAISKLFTVGGEEDKTTSKPKAVKRKSSKAKKADAPRKTKKKGRKDPKLATGLYVNPNDGEQVRKIKRAPKALLDWCEQYGVVEVRRWHQEG